jgi:hypothetical protein
LDDKWMDIPATCRGSILTFAVTMQFSLQLPISTTEDLKGATVDYYCHQRHARNIRGQAFVDLTDSCS